MRSLEFLRHLSRKILFWNRWRNKSEEELADVGLPGKWPLTLSTLNFPWKDLINPKLSSQYRWTSRYLGLRGIRHIQQSRIIGLREPPPHHNHFTALFPGPPGSAGARRELLVFMVQEKINRGRHTDHPAVRHSIWTKQCPPPPSPDF